MTPHEQAFRDAVARHNLEDVPELAFGSDPVVEIESLDVEKLADRKVPLTIDRAVEYIRLPTFEGERPVQPFHIQRLLEELERGRFNWDSVVVARCELVDDGVTYKVNGQHTSWVRLALPAGAEHPVVREVAYRAADMAQLKTLYSTFDRAAVRTPAHLTRIELVGSRATGGLPIEIVTKLIQGIKLWKFEAPQDRRKLTAAETAALVRQHQTVVNAVGSFYDSIFAASRELLHRAPPIAAMMATFEKHPRQAPEFWRMVGEGTGLEKGSAPWRLHAYLARSALHPRASAARVKKTERRDVVEGEEMYRLCLLCFLKWRAGEVIHSLHCPYSRPKLT